MAIFRPLLLSEIQWQYPKNLLPLELHSLVSSVSTQELDCSTGSRKTPAFPRAAPLAKAAVLSVNQPSRSRQPKTTQDSYRLTAAFVAAQGRCGSTGIQPSPRYSTTSMDHTHSAWPGLARRLLAQAGSTRSARYLKHFLITKNLPYLTAFM